MASIRTQIITAAKAKLEGAGKPAGLTVERFRLAGLRPSSLPHTLLRPNGETVQRRNPENLRGVSVERRLTLRLEHRVEVAYGQTVEEALDALTTWGTKALLSDPRLGGLAVDISEESISWEGDDAEADFGLATQDFTIRYTTKTADQEAQ